MQFESLMKTKEYYVQIAKNLFDLIEPVLEKGFYTNTRQVKKDFNKLFNYLVLKTISADNIMPAVKTLDHFVNREMKEEINILFSMLKKENVEFNESQLYQVFIVKKYLFQEVERFFEKTNPIK
ncbi:MAG: hypothetical protein ACOCQR_02915 [bacterium]